MTEHPSREDFNNKLTEFYDKVDGLVYEVYNSEMALGWFNIWDNEAETAGSLFCSEFVAYAFKDTGLYKEFTTDNAANYLPNEFSTEIPFDNLVDGVYFGNEIYMTDPQV